MFVTLLLLGILLLLDIAALYWGVDTTDSPLNPRWVRQRYNDRHYN